MQPAFGCRAPMATPILQHSHQRPAVIEQTHAKSSLDKTAFATARRPNSAKLPNDEQPNGYRRQFG